MESHAPLAYSVNDQVIFLPHANKLISCKTGQEFTLYVTAARCFCLLIKQQGQKVSHQALYETGWEKHGKIVTPNTLYQTISRLRKQLQEAGLSEEIIQTTPRQGWTLSDRAVIKTLQADTVLGRQAKPLQQPDSHNNFCKRMLALGRSKVVTFTARLRLVQSLLALKQWVTLAGVKEQQEPGAAAKPAQLYHDKNGG
ncbi:winged helix-turn-helix domain-containing protein [Erwinia sp. CGal63]|uniref:winged helix-turn-helix domain-containing protein n=1 Tax=Erwinia sp. CGal63 TaxID=2919889 RepID=UPI00300BE330